MLFGVTALVKILRQNKHPNLDNENSDEQNDEKHKFFKPRFLDTPK